MRLPHSHTRLLRAPAHTRCRCTSIPITREWLDEGVLSHSELAAHRESVRQAFLKKPAREPTLRLIGFERLRDRPVPRAVDRGVPRTPPPPARRSRDDRRHSA
jgi:hypothetical protein